MRHRMIRVHPHAHGCTVRAAANPDFPVTQVELLPKLSGAREWVGRKSYPHAAEFDQLAVLGVSVGLADKEDEVAVFFGPDVEAEVAVSDGHGVPVAFAQCIPDDIAGIEAVGSILRGGCFNGCEQYEEREAAKKDSHGMPRCKHIHSSRKGSAAVCEPLRQIAF